jgi:hypothetical protein
MGSCLRAPELTAARSCGILSTVTEAVYWTNRGERHENGFVSVTAMRTAKQAIRVRMKKLIMLD